MLVNEAQGVQAVVDMLATGELVTDGGVKVADKLQIRTGPPIGAKPLQAPSAKVQEKLYALVVAAQKQGTAAVTPNLKTKMVLVAITQIQGVQYKIAHAHSSLIARVFPWRVHKVA